MAISYRTQTLMTLRNLEKEFNRPVLFDELIDNCDYDISIVSKSLDSLDDAGLIEQMGAKWIVVNGKYAKGISTTKDSRPFIDDVIKMIEGTENR